MGESETGSSDIPADEPAVPSEPYDFGPDHDYDAPPDDEEAPLADHIEEMFSRLLVVIGVMAVASALVFPVAEHIIGFLWFSFLPGSPAQCPTAASATSTSIACPRVYHPLGLILARLKVSTLAGFVVALPVLVYESYLFMRPGLYPKERKYYLASVPMSLVLATVGLLFAHFLVLRAIFTYFLYYSNSAAEAALGLGQTFSLIVMMLGFFAAIFQIPLLIMLAIMMGIVTRRWLIDRRLYFWAGFAGIAFIFNPDPTGMAPFIVTATMIALFEGTLGLLWWTGDDTIIPSPDAIAQLRPGIWGLIAVIGYAASGLPMVQSYYPLIPVAVTDMLAEIGIHSYLPVLVAGGLIGLYEWSTYFLREARRAPQLEAKLRSYRIQVWLISGVIGYFANSDPPLIDLASDLALTNVQTLALMVGLIALYELGLGLYRWRTPSDA